MAEATATKTARPAARTTAKPPANPTPRPAGQDNGHKWVGAATVSLTLPQAKRADLRGSIRVPEETRIDILETYCSMCRKPFDEVADVECAHRSDPEMFHGGPIGVRAKRTGHSMPGHDCVALNCNTAAVVAARREAMRNGMAPDTRKPRTAPAAPAPDAKPKAKARQARRPARRATAATPGAATSDSRPDVAPPPRQRPRAANRRPANPLALTLW
jgi:hypothetical protein